MVNRNVYPNCVSIILSSFYIRFSIILNVQLFACIFNFLCRPSFLFATDVFLEKFQKGFLVPLGRPRRV